LSLASLAPFLQASSKNLVPFSDPEDAFNELCRLYEQETLRLQKAFKTFKELTQFDFDENVKIKGYYPILRIKVGVEHINLDPAQSHGIFKEEGVYEMAVSDPHAYHDLLGQLKKLKEHSPKLEFEIGLGEQEIPLHYAMRELGFNMDAEFSDNSHLALAKRTFTPRRPLENYDYAAGRHTPSEGALPLFGYGPSRFDHARHQFFYYTRTPWEALQPFVIFSNYGQYVDGMQNYGIAELKKEFNSQADGSDPNVSNVIAVIRTGHDVIVREGFENDTNILACKVAVEQDTKKGAQMPACHVAALSTASL